MNEWLHDSSMKDTVFKVIMIISSLLLQKPSQKSKSRKHLKALERRMELQSCGKILEFYMREKRSKKI